MAAKERKREKEGNIYPWHQPPRNRLSNVMGIEYIQDSEEIDHQGYSLIDSGRMAANRYMLLCTPLRNLYITYLRDYYYYYIEVRM